ncbi:MAG: NAD(P)H-hydrate epimerase [Candidatus Aenigmarchaeota archaeon]|nr:NAD(P)H-hydrate epimerase [Candidatus Aenigmarchaeota archaeon]
MIFSKKDIPSITVDQMKQIDDIAINRFGVESSMLMENAGRSTAMLARKVLVSLKGKEIVILVGKGNNGGDALVAARFLHNWNTKVSCLIADHPDNQKELTKWHVGILKSMYVNVVYQTEQITFQQLMKTSSLIIDGLIGYNLEGDPKGIYKTLIELANNSGKRILSIDNPSGFDISSGQSKDPCIKANYTLCLALPKTTLIGKKEAGEIWVGDIGVPHEVYEFLDMKVPKIFEERDFVKL